jgi:hypothetical protein
MTQQWSTGPQPDRTPSAPLPRIVIGAALLAVALIFVVTVCSVVGR